MNNGASELALRVIFGDAQTQIKGLTENCCRAALVSRDSDYFALGKSVKDALSENLKVSTTVLDDDFSPDITAFGGLLDYENCDCVVAVGNAELINLARYFASKIGIPCFGVPTAVAFAEIFSRRARLAEREIYKDFKLAPPDKVVIDLAFMAGLKKQAFADAFAEVASKTVAIIDTAAERAAADEPVPDDLVKRVFGIISKLAEIKSEGTGTLLAIINAELALSKIFASSDGFYGAEFAVSKVLEKLKPTSEFENRFYLNAPLIALYEAFLRIDMTKCLVSPDYNARVKRYAELFGADELEIIDRVKTLTLDEIQAVRAKIINAGVLRSVRAASALNKRLITAYGFVYKGRHRRANGDYGDLRTALAVGSLTSGGILKLLGESGVLDCV